MQKSTKAKKKKHRTQKEEKQKRRKEKKQKRRKEEKKKNITILESSFLLFSFLLFCSFIVDKNHQAKITGLFFSAKKKSRNAESRKQKRRKYYNT